MYTTYSNIIVDTLSPSESQTYASSIFTDTIIVLIPDGFAYSGSCRTCITTEGFLANCSNGCPFDGNLSISLISGGTYIQITNPGPTYLIVYSNVPTSFDNYVFEMGPLAVREYPLFLLPDGIFVTSPAGYPNCLTCYSTSTLSVTSCP